jgi:hypothetical protein
MSGGVSMGSKFYFLGGKNYSSTVYYDSTSVYDIVSNSWSSAMNMPAARYGGAAVYLDGRIYYLGGADGGVLTPNFNNNNYFDSVTGTWNSALSLLNERSGCSAVAVNNKIYLIGGVDSNGNAVSWNHEYAPDVPALSVNNYNFDNVNIYPNPADNKIHIDLQSIITCSSVQIINSFGELITEQNIQGDQIDLNVNYLPTGIYILRFWSDDHILYKKLVKN